MAKTMSQMMGVKNKKHPGFKAIQQQIAAKQGIPMENAGAILASRSRAASTAAKRSNPRLMKVK